MRHARRAYLTTFDRAWLLLWAVLALALFLYGS